MANSPDTLTAGVLDLIVNAGPVAKLVLAILALFSVISWALIVEKWWQLRRVKRQTLGFVKVFREEFQHHIDHKRCLVAPYV